MSAIVLVSVLAAASVVVASVAVTVAVRATRRLRQVREATRRLDQTSEHAEAIGRDVAGAVERLERSTSDAREQVVRAERDLGRLAEALHAHGDGVVVVDREGETVLRLDGTGRLRDLRHAERVADDTIRELLDDARRGEVGERELPLFGPPKRVLRIWAHPLVHGDELVGAVAFARDISEARRTEAVRRDFVANVSHELKTPIGALALLAETMASDSDPVVMSQLADRVVREADRLARIVDDLLDLSLIEAQEAPRREPVPVQVLLSEAIELANAAARAASVPIEVAPVDSEVEVVCDRRQVVSALRNLLDNAVKYSDPGALVEMAAVPGEEHVTLQVRDHGIGIPRRDLERIFERFYRVDKARSRETGGTGLGLSIVRHVAAAHGGEVTVDSVEGEGSVFRFRLPRASRPPRQLSEAS